MLFTSWEAIGRTALLGVLAYVALLAMLRVSGKRTLSKMNAFDFVVTVALGSIIANTLLADDTALADGLTALAVLIAAQFAVARTSVRWAWFERLVKSEPRLLLHRGRFLHEAMRAERVSEDEVRAALRQQGLARVEDADAVVLETDGTLTVIGSLPDGGQATALDGVRGR